jgi:hypothetical protein
MSCSLVVNYAEADILSSSNLLTEEQSEDLRLFMRQLPELVMVLQQTGLMKGNTGNMRSEEKIRPRSANVAMHIGSTGISGNPPRPTLNDPPSPETHVATVNSDREKRQEGEGCPVGDPEDDTNTPKDLQETLQAKPESTPKSPNERESTTGRITEVIPEHNEVVRQSPINKLGHSLHRSQSRSR